MLNGEHGEKGRGSNIGFTPADMDAMGTLLRVFERAGNHNDDAVYKSILDADVRTIQGVFVGWAKKGASVEGIKNFARLMLTNFKEGSS